MDMSVGKLRELAMDREAWRAAVHGVAEGRTRLSDWTELKFCSGLTDSQLYDFKKYSVFCLLGNSSPQTMTKITNISKSYIRPLCECLGAELFPTLCDPANCSPPGSSVHGSLQARRLEQAALPSSRGSSPPRLRTYVSCVSPIQVDSYHWAHWEACPPLKASHPLCRDICLFYS